MCMCVCVLVLVPAHLEPGANLAPSRVGSLSDCYTLTIHLAHCNLGQKPLTAICLLTFLLLVYI